MQKSSKRIKGKKDNRQASGKSGREKHFGSRQSGRKAFTEVTGTVQMTRDGFVFVVVKDEPDSDVFVKAFDLNGCRRGDLLAVRSAGAYGEIMASQYNCRRLPKGYVAEEL